MVKSENGGVLCNLVDGKGVKDNSLFAVRLRHCEDAGGSHVWFVERCEEASQLGVGLDHLCEIAAGGRQSEGDNGSRVDSAAALVRMVGENVTEKSVGMQQGGACL